MRPAVAFVAFVLGSMTSTMVRAQDTGATVTGTARCEADGSWFVDWTTSVSPSGGRWSITPGMYQDPLPWQSDSLPFTTTTTGHRDQTDATVGITYGWLDGPTGQWAVGMVANPQCGTDEPAAVAEPTEAAEAAVEPVTASVAAVASEHVVSVSKIARFRAALTLLH